MTVPMKRYPRRGRGLNETRSLCLVAQSFAQPFDGVIHSAVEIHESVGRPDPLPQLFAINHLAGPFQKNLKKLRGWSCSLIFTPCLRSSPARRSTSNTPKRIAPTWDGLAVSMEAYAPLGQTVYHRFSQPG